MSYAITEDGYDHPRLTPAVQGLLAVNVVIFFLQLTLPFPAGEMQQLLGFGMEEGLREALGQIDAILAETKAGAVA